jgi:septum site-determining protein MinC
MSIARVHSGTIARFAVRDAIMPPKEIPTFELKNGTVDTLHLVVRTAEFEVLRDELTARYGAMPDFFSDDAVAIDVRRVPPEGQVPLQQLSDLLQSLRLRPIGVVALESQQEWVCASGLSVFPDRQLRRPPPEEAAPASEPAPVPAPPPAVPISGATTVLIDKPLRSGQRIYAEGDLILLDVVSHGAEIIAGGNIHVYAPLRGRALAGVSGDQEARIFCTCLEPELISIAGIYRTAETPLPEDVRGKAAQVRLDGERLIVEALGLR